MNSILYIEVQNALVQILPCALNLTLLHSPLIIPCLHKALLSFITLLAIFLIPFLAKPCIDLLSFHPLILTPNLHFQETLHFQPHLLPTVLHLDQQAM